MKAGNKRKESGKEAERKKTSEEQIVAFPLAK